MYKWAAPNKNNPYRQMWPMQPLISTCICIVWLGTSNYTGNQCFHRLCYMMVRSVVHDKTGSYIDIICVNACGSSIQYKKVNSENLKGEHVHTYNAVPYVIWSALTSNNKMVIGWYSCFDVVATVNRQVPNYAVNIQHNHIFSQHIPRRGSLCN